MASPSGHEGPQKRMRKGTHSCLECRKRKVRCIWPPDHEQCNRCAARKISCVEQSYGDVPRASPKTKRMRQRINELEAAIGEICRRMDDLGLDKASLLKDIDLELPLVHASKSGPNTGSSFVRTAESSFARLTLSEDLNADLDYTPLFTLLNNDVLCAERIDRPPSAQSLVSDATPSSLQEKYARILWALRPLVPTSQTVTMLLRHSKTTLCTFGKAFPGVPNITRDGFDERELDTIRDHMLSAFELDDIGTITRVLIALATCIQQLPASVQLDPPYQRHTLDLLRSRYLEFADAFLAPDEGLAGSVDGVDCLLALVKFYMNAGLPRKAWVVFRRAATFAQLLGSLNQNTDDQQLNMRKESIQLQIWQLDKVLSLLLGLPYMIARPPLTIDTNPSNDAALKLKFAFKIGEISARVIDRIVHGQTEASYSATLEMDQDTERCRAIIPSSWWNAIPANMTLDALFELCTIKMRFYSLRNHIHLPFVLRNSPDRKYHFSTMMALESSRKMIEVYNVLRDTRRPVLRLCNLVDFHALTAALIIILLLLGDSSIYSMDQHEEDWQLIYSLIRAMNHAALAVPNSVAAQAAQLLEEISKLRYDVSRSHQTFHAVVPYFGEIKIRRRDESHFSTQGHSVPATLLPAADSVIPVSLDPVEAAPYPGNELLLFDYNNFDFSLENSQRWPGPDEEWTSMVDYTLQDGWNWDWNDTEPF